MRQEVTSKIRGFLRSSFQHDVGDDDDIFELGLANSLFALRLVTFVEEEFQMTVENADLKLDNFRSVSALQRLVIAKKTQAAS